MIVFFSVGNSIYVFCNRCSGWGVFCFSSFGFIVVWFEKFVFEFVERGVGFFNKRNLFVFVCFWEYFFGYNVYFVVVCIVNGIVVKFGVFGNWFEDDVVLGNFVDVGRLININLFMEKEIDDVFF